MFFEHYNDAKLFSPFATISCYLQFIMQLKVSLSNFYISILIIDEKNEEKSDNKVVPQTFQISKLKLFSQNVQVGLRGTSRGVIFTAQYVESF